jgi:hypothetical protein
MHRLATRGGIPSSFVSFLREYAASAREYAMAHPESTGVAKAGRYSKKLRSVMCQQATPRFMHLDCALTVTLALDLGYHNENPTAFFESDRQSAAIVRDCYDHMEHWENGFGSAFQPGTAARLIRSGKLPFVDVFLDFPKIRPTMPLQQFYSCATWDSQSR